MSLWGGESCRRSCSSDEHEHIIQRLPASIQAMLLRTQRKLSKSEIETISHATADQRCEALRMIFEGNPADDAVMFLLRAADAAKTLTLSGSVLPTPASETMATEMVSDFNNLNRCNASSISTRAASLTWESEVAVDQCAAPSSLRARGLMPCRFPTFGAGIVSSDDEGADKESLRIAATSPPMPFPHPFATRGLHEISVNARVSADTKKAAERTLACRPVVAVRRQQQTQKVDDAQNVKAPVLFYMGRSNQNVSKESNLSVSSTQPKLNLSFSSAWNEDFQTYIVHPNQLRRLKNAGSSFSPPPVVRSSSRTAIKRQMSSDKSAISLHNNVGPVGAHSSSKFLCQVSAEQGKSNAETLAVRNNERSQPSARMMMPLSARRVTPLKGLQNTKRNEDVFLRLQSGGKRSPGTARTATPRAMVGRAPHNVFLTPRVDGPSARGTSCNISHTLRCTERNPGGFQSIPSSPRFSSARSWQICRFRTPLKVSPARRDCAPSKAAATPRRNVTTRKPLLGVHGFQRLERAATTQCFSSRFERVALGSTRCCLSRKSCVEVTGQEKQVRGRTLSACTKGTRLRRSATAAAWR